MLLKACRPLARAARRLSTTTDHSFMSCIKLENLNPRHLKVEYAVRGELAIKAEEYRVRLKQPNHGLPFDKVVSTNIGNPQQRGLDQKPLTFVRQVIALAIHVIRVAEIAL